MSFIHPFVISFSCFTASKPYFRLDFYTIAISKSNSCYKTTCSMPSSKTLKHSPLGLLYTKPHSSGDFRTCYYRRERELLIISFISIRSRRRDPLKILTPSPHPLLLIKSAEAVECLAGCSSLFDRVFYLSPLRRTAIKNK